MWSCGWQMHDHVHATSVWRPEGLLVEPAASTCFFSRNFGVVGVALGWPVHVHCRVVVGWALAVQV